MPSVSKSQQRYFGAALARKKAGKPAADDPKMTKKQLEEFASTNLKGLPEKVKQKGKKKK